MYFSSELFVKRGPLGHLWLAGTVFHKLSKKVILSCNIAEMCKSIEVPPVPLALPARAQLFLGACRIMDKQARYLLIDAVEAQSRVQLAVTSSNVNLACNRAQAKSEMINIACEFNDYSLPPIPLDFFENSFQDVEDEEAALFLNQANLEDICLPDPQPPLVSGIDMEIDPLIDDMNDMATLMDRAQFDPLALDVDGMHDSLQDLDRVDSVQDAKEQMNIEPGRLSIASTRTKDDTSSTQEAGLASKKRKRSRPKVDSAISIGINVLKQELNDTSKITTTRSKFVDLITTGSTDWVKCVASATLNEMGTAVQEFVELHFQTDASNDKQYNNLENEAVDYEEPGQHGGPNGSVLSAGDGSIELPRRAPSLQFGDIPDSPIVDRFLGRTLGPISPAGDSVGSGQKSHARRVSMKSLASIDSKARHLSSIHEGLAEDFPTPDCDLPITQFAIPEVEVECSSHRFSRDDAIDRSTEILKGILGDAFSKAKTGEKVCDFHEAIQTAVGANTHISRRDAAISFLQLLVLKTMDMVSIEQQKAYGPIYVSPTSLFFLNFSDSMFESA